MAEKRARLLTKKETARYLGISESCVANWIRLNYLHPAEEPSCLADSCCRPSGAEIPIIRGKKRRSRLFFRESEIRTVKKSLINGKFPRLRSRANKTFAASSGLSGAVFFSVPESVRFLAAGIGQTRLEPEAALYFLALSLFCRSGDLSRENLMNACSSSSRSAAPIFAGMPHGALRSGVQTVLADFYSRFSACIERSGEQAFLTLLGGKLPDAEDLPGLVYQLLCADGKKARMGLFYTPEEVADSLVPEMAPNAERILDPCCGTGRILLQFARRFGNPEVLYGIDIDPCAVFAAAVNLLLYFKDDDFTPKLACADFFSDPPPFPFLFEYLATNPPWGASRSFRGNVKPVRKRRRKNQHAGSLAADSFFEEKIGLDTFVKVIVRGHEFLRPGGFFSLVLPESALNVKKHEKIRRYLLEHFALNEIRLWGNCFPGVFSRAVTLKLRKKSADTVDTADTVFVYENGAETSLPQSVFAQNESAALDVFLSPADRVICEKLFAVPHRTLRGNAHWALGIITGNNTRFLLSTQEPGAEAVYCGHDIFPFSFRESGYFLRFTPELFQQTAREEKYRAAEKLVYRFISRRPVFAYDCRKRLTLNSANCVVPLLPECPAKAIAALFNSDLYAFYYQKNFHSLKVLRGALESVPLPILDGEERNILCSFADKLAAAAQASASETESAESGHQNFTHLFERLNIYVYGLFGISESEQKTVRSFLAGQSR